MKTARDKLNSASILGDFFIAGLIGAATGSWLLFSFAFVILLIAAVMNDAIRF